MAVSEALDRACSVSPEAPSGDAARELWQGAADAASRKSAADARCGALLQAFDDVEASLAGVAEELETEARRASACSPYAETGIVPLCAAAVHARLEATRAVARLVAARLVAAA